MVQSSGKDASGFMSSLRYVIEFLNKEEGWGGLRVCVTRLERALQVVCRTRPSIAAGSSDGVRAGPVHDNEDQDKDRKWQHWIDGSDLLDLER
jgi:hypothetical protein